jgi:cytochrome c peroxidase
MSARKICHTLLVASLLVSLVAILSVGAATQSLPVKPLKPSVRKIVKRGPQDTAESIIGERLFNEPRFAQYFASHSSGNVNLPLPQGDPVVSHIYNPKAGVAYPSPFAGTSFSCRTCHFVDECTTFIAGENRTYADFTQRSMIPSRTDGRIVTVRNARNMVDDFTPRRAALLLHADGEFASTEALVKSVMLGRTFGWLLSEHDDAVRHVAKVIREDDGSDKLGAQYGGSYSKLLLGTAPDLPVFLRLSSEYRLDVSTATDQQVVDAVARLIGAFLKSLRFEQTPEGIHTGSAYDMFLAKNNLPLMPNAGESDLDYSRRLLHDIEQLQNPRFILPYERWLRFHPHLMVFGQQELAGLKLFLRTSAAPAATGGGAAHIGNCARCHPAPDFTDMRFHNTGGAQEEFDSVHGAGAFAQLIIPSYEQRSQDPDRYVPATASHPKGSGVFRAIPSATTPSATDLGVWNIYANPNYPDVQQQMSAILCGDGPCDPHEQLPNTIALFRTPSLRDLGHSWPYLHTGRMATVEDVLHFYVRMSSLAREGKLRNGAPELRAISLDEQDLTALSAFLSSLDEDYDN